MTTPLPDAAPSNWVDRHAPRWLQPWLRLGRFDRPTGIWLLMLPGWQGIALAAAQHRQPPSPLLLLLFFLGAALMRAAGCAYNDIVDRDIDAKVARTAGRPIPAGQISVRQAWVFIAVCCAASFTILLTFNRVAIALGVASLALVAAYPFMKRITWWPQAWLGLVFSWGALVGWPAVRGNLDWPALLLWFGSIAWIIGYDTLYAIQDIEDDALVGVKSSARRLGDKAALGVGIVYSAAVLLWAAAIWMVRPEWLALVALAPAAIHLANQALRADPRDGEGALKLFRSNRVCGLLVFLAMLVVGLSRR
jgi:4-hydroxybenzoate polyprenyltransferase